VSGGEDGGMRENSRGKAANHSAQKFPAGEDTKERKKNKEIQHQQIDCPSHFSSSHEIP